MTTATSTIAARPKTTLVSLLIVAFLCGAAGGAAVMRSYPARAPQQSNLTEPIDETLARWKDRLDLSPDQMQQLRSILDDFHKYYDNVVAEGHGGIMKVLKPEQRVKFEKMMHAHQ